MQTVNHRYIVCRGSLILLFGLVAWVGCTTRDIQPQMVTMDNVGFDLQGHRGARGLYPENTVGSAGIALEIGVTTLELDVVISADSQVVVSHDPVISSAICSHPDGQPVLPSEEQSLRLYEMTYDQISEYDCGLRGHEGFPAQTRVEAVKPLLSAYISAAENRTIELNRTPVRYNIETKSSPEGDGILHPDPATFIRLVVEVVTGAGVLDRASIQSFDPRALVALQDLYPDIDTALLISRGGDRGLASNLETLGFLPEAYSPHFLLVTSSLVSEVHQKGMRIIPWTVNEEQDMTRLIELGVDGLITDYPDVGMRVLEGR